MTEEAELQARIAALAGQINKHKQQPSTNSRPPYPPSRNRGASRWTPFGRGAPIRNRTLVLANKQPGTPQTSTDDGRAAGTAVQPSADAFVTTRRVGANGLMTKDAFEREQKQQMDNQQKQINTKKAQQAQQAQRKAPRPAEHQNTTRELDVEGVRYQMLNDGSKLIRIHDPTSASLETPKRVTIAGVTFLRTKHGNLIRASMSNSTQRYRLSDRQVLDHNSYQKRYRNSRHATKPQCENFTKHGNCPFGPNCKFTHDPTKVAVCKEFLRNGSCESGRNCDLSHELTYHRVPACTHFLRGNCTNSACRYPHVHTSPAARVCRPFATLGFCQKGDDCDKRHVFECPDYANHGRCDKQEKGACSLPHIDHAGNLRKAAKRQAKTGSEDESDMSSDDEGEQSGDDTYDIDSDVAEEDIVMGATDESHALSQQQDFIAFT